METLEYLNNKIKSGDNSTQALLGLVEDFSIKAHSNPDYPNLFCLHYDQIESPKNTPVTNECRGLVVGYCPIENIFKVVSRSFDRFFNLGEIPDEDHDITQYTAREKVDGSLISFFYYNGEWLFKTMQMIEPSYRMRVNTSTLSWRALVAYCAESTYNVLSDTECTYIYEIVSPENRVVTRYEERQAYLLGIRNNSTGCFVEPPEDIGVPMPKVYSFNTIDQCVKAALELPNLEEGYVLYDKKGVPRVKVKSPAYVAAHRLRGELVVTTKRIMDIVFMNEQDEFLSIFPEYQEMFDPVLEAYEKIYTDFIEMWDRIKYISDRKEFAMTIKGLPIEHLLYKKHFGNNFFDIFNKLTKQAKYRLMEKYLEHQNN